MKNIIAFFQLISLNAVAKKKFSVVYETNNGDGNFRNTKHLLAINDSVSFSAIISHRNKEYKYAKPLGTDFASHNTYIDMKETCFFFGASL